FVRQRDLFEVAHEELDVVDTGVGGVPVGELEHLVGHVEPDGLAGGTATAGGDEYVGARARAEVEHGLALVEVGHRGGDAATEGGAHRGVGHAVGVHLLVQAPAEGIGRLRLHRATATRLAPAAPVAGLVSHLPGGRGIAFAHVLADVV